MTTKIGTYIPTITHSLLSEATKYSELLFGATFHPQRVPTRDMSTQEVQTVKYIFGTWTQHWLESSTSRKRRCKHGPWKIDIASITLRSQVIGPLVFAMPAGTPMLLSLLVSLPAFVSIPQLTRDQLLHGMVITWQEEHVRYTHLMKTSMMREILQWATASATS